MSSLRGIWNHTEDAKKKISEDSAARWQDPVARAKLLNRPNVKKCQPGCTCGRHTTKACKPGCTCKKHNEPYNKGQPSPLKGRKQKPEAIANQVASRKANGNYVVSSVQKEQISEALTGKTQSEETKRKRAETRATFVPSKELREIWRNIGLNAMRRVYRNNPTSLERPIIEILQQTGIAYKFQEPVGNRYLVDFLLDDKIVLECDGLYWHTLPGVPEKDAEHDAWLTSQGYRVARLLEADIKKDPKQALLAALQRFSCQV